MKVDLKLFAIAIFLLAIPVLMALPQSFLVSDVVLSNNLSSKQGQGQQTPDEERRMPLFGKITAIHNASLEISNANGDTVTVKITSQTEFRKDRQAAKRSDFKVGDVIAVRVRKSGPHLDCADHWRALRQWRGPRTEHAGRHAGQGLCRWRSQRRRCAKISVLRSDNVTQTIELNEDTSLRKGAMRSPWLTCRSAITFWRAAPCKPTSSCPSLLWLLDPNNGNACRKWAECVPVDREIPAWRSFAKTCGAAALKSLAPALLFLLVFASAGLLHAQDPSPPPQDNSTPPESVAPTPTPVATSFQITGIVKAGRRRCRG